MKTENKAVLISIKPKWCELIANGKKTVEVRKTKPAIKTPFKCYIYCTLQGCNELFKDTLNESIAKWNEEKWGTKKGSVIGEFVCDEIETLPPSTIFNAPALYSQSCLTREEFFEYAADDTVYFWHISDLKIYDEPKKISEFGLKRPPQSWGYVEEG